MRGGYRTYLEETPTLRSRDHKDPLRVAIPVLTPDRANKRQDGRRFKEDGEEAFSLTTQDRHGVAVNVTGYNATLKQGRGVFRRRFNFVREMPKGLRPQISR